MEIKRVMPILFIIAGVLILALSVNLDTDIITGRVTQQFNLNMTVGRPPTVTILTPRNETYIENHTIQLSYNSTEADTIFYSLDSGTNTTITSTIYFNVSDGSHKLFLYANNTYGNDSTNISFFVRSGVFNFINGEFKGSNKGNTTNFTLYSYEELQNLSNVVLENTNFGKINFNEAINLTNSLNFTGNETNLDEYVNISLNRIEIDSVNLPNLNKSATLSLYGLTYTNPRALRDGEICPEEICTEVSYTGGIFTFNVTSFSVYTSEETPAATATTGSASKGGNSKTASAVKIFSLSNKQINLTLATGSIAKKTVIVQNNLNQVIDISIQQEGLENIITIPEQVEIDPKKSKEIPIEFTVKEDVKPGLYLGKIILKTGTMTEEISIILEVEHKDALFDLTIEIPLEYTKVLPGKEILVNIEVFSLGEAKESNVDMEYIIEDTEGKIIQTENETIYVNTKESFSRKIKINENIQSQEYILYVKAVVNERFASATAKFTVMDWKIEKLYILIILGSIVLLSLITFLSLRKVSKQKRENRLKMRSLVKKKKC